ncbi:ISL3 family transposase [Candidatus Poriferisodalis sp.]|uniref:ISL3 family transposase n=1 Tax=Candidatus Poriferisodalis sp. TaxID=3101277 RepID=UPI003B016CE3
MEADPTRVNRVLVGLGPGVEVVGVVDRAGRPLGVHVRLGGDRPCCGSCGRRAWSKGSRCVVLVDLPVFGRPVRLVWHKRRWRCPDAACAVGSWTEQDSRIGAARGLLTARAARWATRQAGAGRDIAAVAAELGCGWHTVMASVRRWGEALLNADRGRLDGVTALGMDEILVVRRGRYRRKTWATTAVDVRRGRLLDVFPGRTANAAAAWLRSRPPGWRRAVRWAVLDLSGPYRKAFGDALAHARQVADPFHVVRLANSVLDEVRRRVQNDTLGGRGTKHDPLYRIRKLLVMAKERVARAGQAKLQGLLAAGDPHGEVRDAWLAKEAVRDIYQVPTRRWATAALDELARDLQDDAYSPELNRLGRTLAAWRPQITNWHASRATNGPTEAANNLAKRVKRVAFGFTNFDNFRIRALLYAGKPDWTLLKTLTPP